MEKSSVDFDKDRLEKLNALRIEGFEPYGDRFEKTASNIELKGGFERLNDSMIKAAGRIIARRDHGKIKFLDLRDDSGTIQVYILEERLDAKSKKLLDFLEPGDIIGAEGRLTKTKTGEISVLPNKILILAKALLPLPPKWYGLEDTEKRYRKRYLDFIMNPDSKEKIKKSSEVIAGIRGLLDKKGFIEVIVPILQPIPGGAHARPFVTHYNALDRDLYLKIASELYLKRMLVGGFEKVYDISKDFRNEGVDTRHNPEFTMLELYQAYGDLSDMMNLTQEIVKAAVYTSNGTFSVPYGDAKLDFSKFSTKTMEGSVREVTGNINNNEMIERAKKIDKKVTTYGEAINTLFEEEVQKTVIQPTFITNFPVEVSPLAKSMKNAPGFVYRFELYVMGTEIANAFSELNDPLEQIERFNFEASRKEKGVDETQEFDRDFIEALGYGMPPTGGVGIGIDRLQMLCTNSKSIKEVIPFPQLKTL